MTAPLNFARPAIWTALQASGSAFAFGMGLALAGSGVLAIVMAFAYGPEAGARVMTSLPIALLIGALSVPAMLLFPLALLVVGYALVPPLTARGAFDYCCTLSGGVTDEAQLVARLVLPGGMFGLALAVAATRWRRDRTARAIRWAAPRAALASIATVLLAVAIYGAYGMLICPPTCA